MKKLLLIASSAIIVSVSACPDLAGSYNCVNTHSDGFVDNYSMTIKQNGNQLTMTDEEGSYTVIADGKERKVDGVLVAISCVGNTVVSKSDDSFTDDETGQLWDVVMNSTISKNGRVMTSKTSGVSTSGSMTFEYSNTEVCTQL